MTTSYEDIVELAFPLIGSEIPADHGYSLYSAVSGVIADAHCADWIGIHTIRGRKARPGVIRIGEGEALRLRLPLEKMPVVYKLSGERLRLGNSSIRCGLPTIRLLTPSANLRSRLVVIKTAHEPKNVEPENFLKSLHRKLLDLNISANAHIERTNNSHARRVVRIKDNIIVGYGVVISELKESDSLIIQAVGIGGRRRMGCGLFEPINSVNAIQEISV
jgi:CRISPR-associated protein Cas6